jgi:hypothetical protein
MLINPSSEATKVKRIFFVVLQIAIQKRVQLVVDQCSQEGRKSRSLQAEKEQVTKRS